MNPADRPLPPEQHAARLAKRHVAAGVLILDGSNRVLLVQPTYKAGWEIPGGSLEAGEAPAQGAERECVEELGVNVVVGRLLVVEHQSIPGRGDSIMFIYDAELPAGAELRLPPAELAGFRYVAPQHLHEFVIDRLATRVKAAITARRDGTVVELSDSTRRWYPAYQRFSVETLNHLSATP